MAKFVRSSFEDVNWEGVKIKNSPVNIDLVLQVQKGTEKFYHYQNGAKTPVIKFYFNPIETPIFWVYPLDQESVRDDDFKNIINNC